MTQFIHLRVHSDFSLANGLAKVKALVGAAAKQKMPALALTDQTNLCGAIKFYKACEGAGVKPIIGSDLRVVDPDMPGQISTLCLLVCDHKGYRNLTRLISRAYTDEQRQGDPVVNRHWIREHAEGLIALSCAQYGDVGQALLAGKQDLARTRLDSWSSIFGDRFYLEVQRTGRNGDDQCVYESVMLAQETGCPVVATNDVHFLSATDFEAHEARVCIGQSRTLDDSRRSRDFSDAQYFKSAEEMAALFADLPEAIENTVEIAKRCSLTIPLGKYFLPNYPIPEGMTLDQFFVKVSEDGLQARLEFLYPDEAVRAERYPTYRDRLKFELDIITQMGFPGYFLIVMDFIRWARENKIPVGPGRGSGAGSLVAYVLGITDLDPLAYDLLFERFLNPERVSMPDFDVDFCMDGRDDVINYVAETYGRTAVSQIITFGTMAAKAVVRDVARVQGKPYSLGDRLSKMIPFEVGMTLSKAWEQEEALRDYINNDEEAAEVWEMAVKLEGVTRNVGKHAGGVVIAPTELTDFSPLYCDEHGGGLVTQYDKDDVESAGLVKFDFLGLRTLTIVDWAIKIINAQREKINEPPLDIARIDLEDKAVFDTLKRAETTAVFQLESRGMKELIRRLLPDRFEDIIALVALFRPGPLQSGMVDDFINRKHGRAPLAYPHTDFQHESLKPVLEPTYGIILYQEQVMQIAQVMAGYSLGGADLLRRAMGKKKQEEMDKQKAFFVDGSEQNGISRDLAEKIFDLVEKFAGYGFNKSHSAAYALVSYQTAWLKTNYPAPFMAAVLTAEMQNTDKVVTLIEECRRMKLVVRLPDVNVSSFTFTVNDDGDVVYGLGAVKGLGEGPVQSITEARKNGPFEDLFDFCRRVDLRKVNKRALEALIKSGALDALGPGRAKMLAVLEDAVKQADQHNRNESAGMMDMFGDDAVAVEADPFASAARIREWSDKQRLAYEKDTLGLYLSGHPFDEYESEARRFARLPIAELQPAKDSRKIAGLVVAMRTMKTKRGHLMGFVTLDDRTARIEVAFFGEALEVVRDVLAMDQILVIEGEVEEDTFSGGLRVRGHSAVNIADARNALASKMTLAIGSERVDDSLIGELSTLLQQFKPANGNGEGNVRVGCPVSIRYQHDFAEAELAMDDSWRVSLSDDLLHGLRYLLGDQNVAIVYN
ncbi:MAG: DNA polymerase III subunit alpha [unclassified Hahellaceae]|nr:DNA polymerase III subunit alpha [Hahellaceae bacterium]|tara:strand:+ start:6344 stop:9844 length:3501 start_codon:yes stop_codon:yes gene_type:complete